MIIKTPNYIRTFFFYIILISIVFTQQSDKPEMIIIEFPVTLYISSQNSSKIDPVNIKVIIDNKEVIVNQEFFARDGHNHKSYKLKLTKGSHRIVVESSNGKAGLDVIFDVDQKLWLSLSYWGEYHFHLNISKQKLAFI